jgi:hypothetical protein
MKESIMSAWRVKSDVEELPTHGLCWILFSNSSFCHIVDYGWMSQLPDCCINRIAIPYDDFRFQVIAELQGI